MALRTDKTGFGDIEIVQDDSMFCYGIDAVLLSDFAARRLNERKKAISELCDLGTGNGIIPLILSLIKPIYGESSVLRFRKSVQILRRKMRAETVCRTEFRLSGAM